MAFAAFRAGIEVEQVLPGEVGDEAVADLVGLCVQGDRREHRPRLDVADRHARGPGHHVHGLREGDRGDEAERHDAVHPPLDVARVVRRGPLEAEPDEPLAGEPAEGRPLLEAGVLRRDPEGLQEEAREREEEENSEERPVSDHVRLSVVLALGAVRPPVVEAKRLEDPPLDRHDPEPDDQRHPEDVQEEGVAEVEPALPKVEAEHWLGEVVLEGEDRRPDEEDEEAVEDEQVPRAGERVAAADPGVVESRLDGPPQAAAGLVEHPGRAAAAVFEAESSDAPEEERRRDDDERVPNALFPRR
jgi:hypothetical protein